MPPEAVRLGVPSAPSRPLLPATADDRFFDYCLQPYQPRASPIGKLRAENLLWHSLDLEGLGDSLGPVITRLQQRCGRDMTVFGIKEDGSGRLFWELYFYDPKKEDARVTATSVIDAITPVLKLGPTPRESIPYFMFSFDLSAAIAAAGQVDGINLYLAAREVQAGRSYKLTSSGMEFENTYRFLHPKTEIDKILHGIRSSVFVDFDRNEVSKVLFPELFNCNRICIAKKRRSDAIYYSGIDIDQLLWFLRHFRYPERVIQFTEAHRAGFSHLLFDVGIDYGADAQGRVRTGKTSFYGTF